MPRGAQAARSEVATAKVLDAALHLFSSQGYGATSMRQIAEACDQSVGNLYHHFGSKEAIYKKLIDGYLLQFLQADHPLQKVFVAARFPDDLEDLAAAIELTVERNKASIMLVFIDVIEFGGRHIRWFYETMADRFKAMYGERFEELDRQGRLTDADPMVAVMVATRWLFYFYTVEKCFGVPMHFGMDAQQAVDGFIRILRNGLLRGDETAQEPNPDKGGRS
ncbi:MAG: TetR/AcrR family transcriptional regulator [Thermoanaerobaculales bacterium]|nr:TetR/AcrR family transcriptional regulator [Thermoanaerobaculales bacterium]